MFALAGISILFFRGNRRGSSKEIKCKTRAEKHVVCFAALYTMVTLGRVLCLEFLQLIADCRYYAWGRDLLAAAVILEVTGLCSALIFFPNPLQLMDFFLKIVILHLYFVAWSKSGNCTLLKAQQGCLTLWVTLLTSQTQLFKYSEHIGQGFCFPAASPTTITTMSLQFSRFWFRTKHSQDLNIIF